MAGGHRVLIVDDDPIYIESTKAVLESQGYEVVSAQDKDDGMAKMREQLPDVVLLDVMMSWVLEGVNISREMMEDRQLRSIPIIMITSIRSSEHRGAFPQDEYLHIDSWLDKPCPPEKLVAEVESVISRHQEYRDQSRGEAG